MVQFISLMQPFTNLTAGLLALLIVVVELPSVLAVGRSSISCVEGQFPMPGCDHQPSDVPVCSFYSPVPCQCSSERAGPDTTCDVDSERFTRNYGYAYCEDEVTFYATDGTTVTGRYCNKLVFLSEWGTRAIRPATAPPAEKFAGGTTKHHLQCMIELGYTWRDEQCLHETRYLGEQCEKGLTCHQDGDDNYRLSCLSLPSVNSGRATCLPSLISSDLAGALPRKQCTCNWFDWNFLVICGSDDCNGHPCVINEGDMKKYCDYSAKNNW